MRSLKLGVLGALVLGCSSGANQAGSSGSGGAGAGGPGSASAGQGGAVGSTTATHATTGSGGHGAHSGTGGQAGGGTGGGATGGSGGGSCTPKSTKCANTGELETCNAQGNGYTSSFCPVLSSCAAGACSCTPGAVACMGSQVIKCGQDAQPHPDIVCPAGSTCSDGLCKDDRCPDEVTQDGSTGLPTTGWARFRHDNRNSATSTAIVADKPTLKWKVFIGGTGINGSHGGLAGGAVVNQSNVIFVGGGDLDGQGGAFHALDANGNSVYSFDGKRGYGWTTPAVRKDGIAYYATADGSAYAVNPNGTQLWKFSFGSQDDSHPIVTKDGYVIFGSDSGSLFALQPVGTQIWMTDPTLGPGEVDSGLAESCAGQLVAGGRNGFFGLDAQSGATLWHVPTTGDKASVLSSPALTADGTMYGVDSGQIGYAIDKQGTVLWQKQLLAPPGNYAPGTDVLHAASSLYVVLDDGDLHALDATTGDPLWQQPVNNTPEPYHHPGPVMDGKQRIYYSSNDGNLYAFDTTGVQLWKQPTSGVATPDETNLGNLSIGQDGTIYVPGNDGNLYAFH